MLTADGAGNTAWEDPSGGEGGGHEILDDGTPMPQRAALDFVGFDLADDDYGDATIVTLPEGAYAETVGDGVEVTYDVVHDLATTDVVVRAMQAEARAFQETRKALVARYADGEGQVPAECREELGGELESLLAEEIELDLPRITEAELASIEMTVEEALALAWMIGRTVGRRLGGVVAPEARCAMPMMT